VSVHDAGANFPKKYQDNFISNLYSRDVVLPPELVGTVALVKNVMLERPDGTLRVLIENEHYRFDAEQNIITFFVEFFDYAPIGANVQYTCELYSETLCGVNELVLTSQILAGEVIGAIYSLEGDVSVQVDFWGSDPKQTEWMLQRFRNLWINERKLRRSLAAQGLITMNLSWTHGGTSKSLDKNLRPYLYNISAMVKFTTEYRVMELAEQYVADFDNFSAGSNWLGTIAPSFQAEPIREVAAKLVLEPFRLRMVIPWGNDNKLLNTGDASYGVHNTMGQITFKT
jgi:hypothetical protein